MSDVTVHVEFEDERGLRQGSSAKSLNSAKAAASRGGYHKLIIVETFWKGLRTIGTVTTTYQKTDKWRQLDPLCPDGLFRPQRV